MSAFDYLAVLISIVLGLGIANILSGLAAIVRARARITSFVPTYIQMANIFVIHVQVWWAMFGLRDVQHWTFPLFFVVLMQAVFVFLLSAFIVPEIPPEGGIDLREAYFREHAWFGAALFLAVADSALRNVMTNGAHFFETPEPIAHAVFAVLGLVGFFTRSPRAHMVLAPIISLVLAFYVGALFVDLH